MILETLVTTTGSGGDTHIAPMGIRESGGLLVLAPFRPSTTLENLTRTGQAIVNLSDNVAIFAGCLTGRTDWALEPGERVGVQRLADCLAHREVQVAEEIADELRPRFLCRVVYAAQHGAFRGFNRAQAAVIEASILVSRLGMLSESKIRNELAYLKIAVEKTAGDNEKMAWEWLMERIATALGDHVAGVGR